MLQFWLKTDDNNGHFTQRSGRFSALNLLEIYLSEFVSNKSFREKRNTHSTSNTIWCDFYSFEFNYTKGSQYDISLLLHSCLSVLNNPQIATSGTFLSYLVRLNSDDRPVRIGCLTISAVISGSFLLSGEPWSQVNAVRREISTANRLVLPPP
jgi:hypothetical protein